MRVATAASSTNSMSLVSEGIVQQQSNENPKELCSGNADLNAPIDVEWLREAAIELHCSVHVGVTGLDHALEFMLAVDL